MPTKLPRVYVTLTPSLHKQVKNIAMKKNCSVSDVMRELTEYALNIQVTQENLDYMSSFLRDQLNDCMRPYMDRIISLQAKTCIQAGTAAYLSAEAIRKFVPSEEQLNVVDSYDAARKKALEYTRRKIDLE